jgi:hypothetical protein
MIFQNHHFDLQIELIFCVVVVVAVAAVAVFVVAVVTVPIAFSNNVFIKLHVYLNRTKFMGFLLMLLNSSRYPSTTFLKLSRLATST